MADTLAVDIRTSIQWLFEEALDLSNVVDSAKLEFAASLADGTGSGQADQIWHDTRTLAAAANDDLDLTALTHSIHGSTVTIALARLKALLIYNLATAADEDLYLDSSVSNACVAPFAGSSTSQVAIPAGSPLLLVNHAAGWTVTGGSADVLRIHNEGAGSVDYKIVVVGTSA